MNLSKYGLRAATVVVLVSGSLWGQTPNPNSDIVKMIQAGLPESTVVNKIREGAGHWDTSVDGLIVLKQAGATSAELDILTAAVPPPPLSAAPSVVQVMGGYLSNHGGDYTLFEPGLSPKDYLSNMLFHIVVVDGHPALRLSVRGDYIRKMYGHCYSTWGDLIIEHDKVTYYPYGRINWAFVLGKWKSETMAPDPSLKPYSLTLASVKPKEWDPKKIAIWDVHLTDRSIFSDDDFPYSFAWGSAFEKGHTMPSQEFLSDLFNNFDGTMAQILQAASISDADKQLAPEFHFRQPTEAEIPALLVPLNRDVARWRTAVLEERKERQAEQAASGGGNGFLELMNVMQGVTNMAQAQNQANVAVANHDMAGQMQAAMNAGRAEAQTLNAISNPNAPAIQPLAATDPNAIQNATNQQLANIQAKQAQAAQAQRIAAATQVARNTAPTPVAAKTASPSSASAGSGTVAPPTCVDLGPGNCMPIAQYQQMMAQKNQQAAQMQVCPASGFVPGPGHYAACDAYIGERYFCTPGQSVPIQKPVPPPASCGGTQSSGNGGGTPIAGSQEPTENACLQMSRDAQGMPVFHNVCSFALKYYYTPVNPRKGEYKEQNGILAPGETQTGLEGNGEQVLYYACKEGDLVVGPDGSVITQAVNSFGCVKP